MKLPIWFFMPEWARAKYREHLQSEADGEYEQLKKNAEQNAHLTPESLASSQAVVNASALEQSDDYTPPAQAQVA